MPGQWVIMQVQASTKKKAKQNKNNSVLMGGYC